MKRFLFRLSIFFTCIGTLFFCLLFFTSWVAKRNNDFRIKSNTHYIVLGHSHAECAYNDQLIENFENFSQSGESYFYTLPKIKEIIRKNSQVKTVLLEFTNNQITQTVEEWITGKKYLGYYYAMYFPYINPKDHLQIVKKVPLDYLRNLPITTKDLLKKSLSTHKYAYEYGGFKAVEGNLSSYQINKTQHQNENFVEIKQGVSNVQIHYLKEIITFLDDNDIELILVRSPQHSSYQGFANERDFNNLLKTDLPNVKFLDLAKFPLSDNEFRDPEHINKVGAEKLSNWLNQFLKNDVLPLFKIKKHIDYHFVMDKKSKNDR